MLSLFRPWLGFPLLFHTRSVLSDLSFLRQGEFSFSCSRKSLRGSQATPPSIMSADPRTPFHGLLSDIGATPSLFQPFVFFSILPMKITFQRQLAHACSRPPPAIFPTPQLASLFVPPGSYRKRRPCVLGSSLPTVCRCVVTHGKGLGPFSPQPPHSGAFFFVN